jgi:uncharacterized protein (DUF1697 family)
MPRYAALLRGVSPMNCRMPELRRAFESAGFDDVQTLLSSGNVTFEAARATESALQEKAEAAMAKHMGKAFVTLVRPIAALRALLESNPYEGLRLAPNAKRVVTFLRSAPKTKLALPIAFEGATIVAMTGREVFSYYLPHPKGAAFMVLLEKTYGKDQTTRTWQTVERVAGQ